MCFYNGTQEQPEKQVLKLSDAYDGEGDIEVRVTMLNINYGKNQQLMDACKPLKEYAWVVDAVRRYQQKKLDLDAAVDAAINEMPDHFVIKPFLVANRSEVKNMFLTEYDEKKVLEMEREEGRAEGRVEGKEDATVSSLQTIMKKMKLSAEKAMDFMDIPPEDQPKYALLLKES